MLSAFRKLPRRGCALSLVKSYLQHRCDLRSIGFARETNAERYRFDNRNRGHGWLFQYTLDGAGRFRDDDAGVTHVMGPGRGFLASLTSNTGYWLPKGSEWEFVYIIFSGEQADYHARRLTSAWGHVHDLPPRSRPVASLLELYRAAVEGPPPDEFLASALVYRFLMEMHSFRGGPSEGLRPEIERARNHVKEHYAELGLGIEDLARVAGYSRYHFTRLFKQQVGIAPYAYLLRFRLRRALERISSTDDPIKKIAGEVGFSDYAYFCNVFKKYTGSTPAGVRKNMIEIGAKELLG